LFAVEHGQTNELPHPPPPSTPPSPTPHLNPQQPHYIYLKTPEKQDTAPEGADEGGKGSGRGNSGGSGGGKQAADGEAVMCIAGLWDVWTDPDGQEVRGGGWLMRDAVSFDSWYLG